MTASISITIRKYIHDMAVARTLPFVDEYTLLIYVITPFACDVNESITVYTVLTSIIGDIIGKVQPTADSFSRRILTSAVAQLP